ncbi:SAYSvFN domain-containing protein 1 [Synchiropus picturatus]
MEKKLADFRERRRAEDVLKNEPSGEPQPESEVTGRRQAEATSESSRSAAAAAADPGRQDGSDWLLDSAPGRWLASQRRLTSHLFALKLLLWLVLLGLFAELEFGLPFFVVSLFYWLYEGLRSPAPRQPGELSAYSVFNPGCRPLLGSLTAEQLEGEMGYRPLANT